MSDENLGKIGWSLRMRPPVFVILYRTLFECSSKFILLSINKPRCFWDSD